MGLVADAGVALALISPELPVGRASTNRVNALVSKRKMPGVSQVKRRQPALPSRSLSRRHGSFSRIINRPSALRPHCFHLAILKQ